MNEHVIWHDLECGSYDEDLGLWGELAARHGGPILDVGAGTGRVALELARAGHAVTALDLDGELLGELTARAEGLPVTALRADARDFSTDERFALCIVPMQTIQLLGGSTGRRAFMACARAQLVPGGIVALAIAEELEPFEIDEDGPGPLPDICERDGIVYSSQPTAVRVDGDGFVLERRREIVDPRGERNAATDRIRLDRLDSALLEREGASVGLSPAARSTIPASLDYVGSEVVVLRA
ncbi:MAG TPA: class I SAM-dependent methyltransferase [Solirubrobacteraceae bacterium]|jgi:SAM-dependent methyltransferase|nr:class I SAM-dependent methyltransferase [Solirubrobacteraceae bacterium]